MPMLDTDVVDDAMDTISEHDDAEDDGMSGEEEGGEGEKLDGR